MPLINGALQIGRSGIMTSQAALAVTGNNMANAATPSYSRQSPHLAPTQYSEVLPGQFTGTGVTMIEIVRQVDDALNGRIRTALGDSASYQVQDQALARVEAAFNELTDSDLSTRVNAFFEAWSTLQNQPQETASRSVVLQEGTSLANAIGGLRGQMTSIQDDLDAQVRFQVSEADSLAAGVARLNQQIVSTEAGRSGSSAALRDQRDDLLKQLGQIINIRTNEMEGGAVNVYVGNDPLIQYSQSRGLSYRESTDENGSALAQVVFDDNDLEMSLSSGKLHGLITARDDHVGGVLADLDTWASGLIFEVNKLHSLGAALNGFTSMTSAFAVDDPAEALSDMDASGLEWQVTNGVFTVNVTDAGTGTTTSTQIKVDVGMGASDTTLTDLATALNAVSNMSASVNASNQLVITADSGFTFGFSAPDDSSNATNVLAALGVNTFFSGSNGNDMALRSDLVGHPRMLVASANGMAGNGQVAGAIAQLATSGVSSFSGVSIGDHLTSLVGSIGADAKAAQDNYTAADVVLQTLEAERQSISGVSIDEEAVNMIIFQRAFQGAAQFIGIIDEMLDEVIALAR